MSNVYDTKLYGKFANNKENVMTGEEIEEYNQFVWWYRTSWRDKQQRGLLDLWEEIDLYWEGDVNQPETEEDPGSNTNIIHPNIEGEVALLIEQNMAVSVKPRGPSDKPYADTVRLILEWIKEQNKMVRKMDIHERRRKKFGTGIFRVLFDSEYMDGFGLPTIEPVQPAYLYVDPNITNVYKIQDAEYIIEAVNKSIYWAGEQFGEEKAAAIIPSYDSIEGDVDLFGEDEGENDYVSRDNYIHLYVWTKNDDGSLRLVQLSSDGVKLEDSNEEDTYFPDATYPYFITPMYFREGTIWGKGDAELLLNSQNLIDDIDDQIRINARLTGNPQKVISTQSGIDINKATNEPGLNIPSHQVEGIKFLQPPNMAQYAITRREYALEYESQRLTRFSDQQTGLRQKGVDTATEALQLQQAGTAGVNHKKRLLQETMSVMFSYILKMVKEYYTEEQAYRITEKEDEFMWFRGSELKEVPVIVRATQDYRDSYKESNPTAEMPDEMILLDESKNPMTKEAIFDISITIGAGMPNNKAFQYTMMRESVEIGAITMPEYRSWMVNDLGLPVPEEPELPPQPPQGQVPGQPPPSPDVQGMTASNNVGGV